MTGRVTSGRFFYTMPLRTAPHSNGYLNGEITMALTAQEIFAETVQSLPPDEQFRLAALILQELSQSGITVVDRRDTRYCQM